MFFLHSNGHTMLLLIYVDDIIVTASYHTMIHTYISHLQSQFAIEDFGPLTYFLGIEVKQTDI
jgi:Reverse transcriptase (RNA-dependent DNA polymerase)